VGAVTADERPAAEARVIQTTASLAEVFFSGFMVNGFDGELL
jgi:hypothetical protein